jgi:hypothetical protein
MSNLIERLKFNGFNGKENVLHRTRRWTVERAEAAERIAELESYLANVLILIAISGEYDMTIKEAIQKARAPMKPNE